ncbi:hypothetical protein WMY93_008241 [Mugilogobius chulae]|uniref:PDZ domain-containing protein n=1 Tax=Mugilogobius chulae TaxID=88201 RepID=A0AAW0PFG4_9GOBI
MNEGPQDGGSCFKKKRSKSADMFREDSMEFSLSDLSHLTSTEEIVGVAEDEEEFTHPRASSGSTERASSLDHLCSQRKRFTKNHSEPNCDGDEEEGEEGLMSPTDEEGSGYGAFTLPCRRSHCLSEGLSGLGIPAPPCPTFQGRRAQTTQDISGVLGEGSEYGDSGIDGVTTEMDGEAELLSRRCKAMSTSFSVYSAADSSIFNGSDSGSSSAGGGDGRGEKGGEEESMRTFVKSWTIRHGLTWAETAQRRAGTVRKAGVLYVKNFLVHKKNKKVETATRRKWKRYWVSLRGCTLYLYETDGRSGIDHNSTPKHALWVENSIVQAVPEHPKKDFVFCLSNSIGDAFLFQTSTPQRRHGATAPDRDPKLEQKIDMDEKMKKMGDMQLSTVTDTKKRKKILEQIFLWEQNLERFHMDLFRCRHLLCFLFSCSGVGSHRIQHKTKKPNCYTTHLQQTQGSILFLWGLDTTSKRKSKTHPSISQVFVDGMEPVRKPLERMFEDSGSEKSKEREGSVKSLPQQNMDTDIWVPDYLAPSWVCLPNDQPILAIIRPGETVLEVLSSVCKAHKLETSSHYLRLKVWVDHQMLIYVPKLEEEISDVLYKEVEISPKATKVVRFEKYESSTAGYGFSVAVIDEDGTQQLHITKVKPDGLAANKGIRAGDEIYS